MIKTIGTFEIPEHIEPDEYWRDHTGPHAEQMMRLGGDLLRGYVINRRVRVVSGRVRYYGLVELWFDDEAARAEFGRRTDSAVVEGAELHFEEYVEDFGAAVVEEHVVVPPPASSLE